MTAKRWALIAGSAGLAAGLALGVTGLASATSPSPTPSPKAGAHAKHPFDKGPGRGFEKGFGGFKGRALGRAAGLVSAVSANSLTLRSPVGTKTIGLTGATTYYNGQTKATKSVVHVGDIVGVRLVDPKTTNATASVVTVVPAHLVGWVTKVDGSTITIVDGSGFTRTIKTSSTTVYKKAGAAGSASDIKVGTLVHAIGAVDSDGTTLDATSIGTGFPGMNGRHAFGGPGPDSVPESGSNSAPDSGPDPAGYPVA